MSSFFRPAPPGYADVWITALAARFQEDRDDELVEYVLVA